MLSEKRASRSALRVALPQREWEDLACLDPLWGILSAPSKQFGKWDMVEFFASGNAEIEKLMMSCALSRGDNGKVLDFGCGVGRLSKALVPYFGQVYGVDISAEMVKLARTQPCCLACASRCAGRCPLRYASCTCASVSSLMRRIASSSLSSVFPWAWLP